ncbi:hypothetical protein DH2020_038172 [Rehmannia glutinosa]|uniref:Nuclease associated modular domain-containing protein n=1 Tax=Rehmannia glutinosa TaxID=99300 RepID=A0ABR0V022_REHGL
MIKAVATLETASVKLKNDGVKGYENMLRVDIDSVRSNFPAFEPLSSSEDSMEVGKREKLRRMRISKANKGNTPWNKGRKHSPGNIVLALCEETRIKIGMGVRLGCERRREKLMLQMACQYEWLDLIAEAARKGLFSEEELQWDSYKTLNEQLEQEWLQSIEERRNMARPMGNYRAPKSAEQKRKIAEAISAKWADPEYRNRVCSAQSKFHGKSERAERKPRTKPSGDGQTRKRSPKHEIKTQAQRVRIKRSKTPSYKDPFASSKLEMLKTIRAQRAAAVNPKSEAISKAKLLIAEAEKAVEALEIAALKSLDVRTSLTESKTLIAEAIQFIKSIENEDSVSFQNVNDILENSTEPVLHVEEEIDANTQAPNFVNPSKLNGVHSLSARVIEDKDRSFNFVVPYHAEKVLMKGLEVRFENTEGPEKRVNIIKKWVKGRLVEEVNET